MQLLFHSGIGNYYNGNISRSSSIYVKLLIVREGGNERERMGMDNFKIIIFVVVAVVCGILSNNAAEGSGKKWGNEEWGRNSSEQTPTASGLSPTIVGLATIQLQFTQLPLSYPSVCAQQFIANNNKICVERRWRRRTLKKIFIERKEWKLLSFSAQEKFHEPQTATFLWCSSKNEGLQVQFSDNCCCYLQGIYILELFCCPAAPNTIWSKSNCHKTLLSLQSRHPLFSNILGDDDGDKLHISPNYDEDVLHNRFMLFEGMKSLCDTRCVTTAAGVQLARTQEQQKEWNGMEVQFVEYCRWWGELLCFTCTNNVLHKLRCRVSECRELNPLGNACQSDIRYSTNAMKKLGVRVEWVGILHNTNNKIREFHMLSHSLRIVVTHQDCIESHCIASAGDQEWNKVVIEASRFQEIVPKMIIRHWMKWRCRCRIINIYLFVFVKRAGDWKQFPGIEAS